MPGDDAGGAEATGPGGAALRGRSRPSRSATAFAPASLSNLAVGFDVLGVVFPVLGDRVTVRLGAGDAGSGESGSGVTVSMLCGDGSIPEDPASNTASVAAAALAKHVGLGGPIRVEVEKGVPLSAGLGGSAASAVGAVVALNALLDEPLDAEELLPFALEGEAVASGGVHPDNVVPCLVGGVTATLLTLPRQGDGPTDPTPPRVVRLPAPAGLRTVVVHPHVRVETRRAREVLDRSVPLADHVAQSACLAGFVSALHTGDMELLRASMRDLVVGPQRAHLIPGYDAARRAALEAGALGCAISGAGPSIFAWVDTERDGTGDREGDDPAVARVERVIRRELEAAGATTDAWTAPVGGPGARVVDGPGQGRPGRSARG